MGARGSPQDNDQPTVDLGPRPPTDGGAGIYDDGSEGTESLADPAGDFDTRTVQGPRDLVHGLPTQQIALRGRPTGHTGSLTRMTGASATTTSPVEAMRHDELARTRVFLKVAVATAIAGAVLALLTTGDPIGRWAVVIGCVLVVAGAGLIAPFVRDAATYEPFKTLPGVMLIGIGAMGGLYYWGAASPVAAMIVYGIYFFSLGSSARITLVLYVLIALLHGTLAVGIATGAIVDRGIIRMSGLDTTDQVGVILVIEFLYFIAFYTARVSQRVTLDAMSKLEAAVRSVAQRDALLAEARAELDRALKIGGPGRYSEQTVGSFRLGMLIGRGGMGEVYEAHAVADRTEAAVKLLHPGTLADPTHVQRFLREAEMASRLDCPHVVRVLEVGTTAGETPFLAMERLRGFDLAHQLRRQRKLQLLQAKVFADQVAIGLEAARAAGIVHRDLKPHNVFFAEQNGHRRWKILDFGVSKSGGSGTLTQGHVVGTPAYMAPEQARGEDVDHRADVYSLAAILYRAVTGHPAFSGKDVPSTLYDVVYRVPTQPTILATVPTDVDRVLAIGLAKQPKDRFDSAAELARWFSAAVDEALDLAQRQRADDVIARYPWGTRPGISTTP
ncbi:MAG: protein kinase [Deltaproteobacteria bacterium]|nr:protein kinase [Deltaproteobacteria bacterium]MDQ3295797.1 protein kinase [Myxococcota bacterium]